MDVSVREAAELFAHVTMGAGLAACAGLRAFLPLFVVGAAGRLEFVQLSDSFAWLSSTPALIVFGVAVVAEILGDKFPAVDNLLDGMQVLVKPLAGAFVMASVVTDWAPLYMAVIWIVSGGALAGLVHLTKAKLRLVSTLTTAGIGNPVLSVTEDASAVVGSMGAIFVPPLFAAVALVAVAVAWLALNRLRKRSPSRGSAASPRPG